MAKPKIVIVGAGVSGLICALELERKGYAPVLIDELSEVGGRLQTVIHQGTYLDKGFQVLLTAYPMVQQYLDLEALSLSYFRPGALIVDQGAAYLWGDPLRDSSFLKAVIQFPLATWSDKWKVFQLSRKLKRQSIETIFSKQGSTTLDYLKDLGFSDQIINAFFKPFFAGIFLEKDLATSSNMFEFVFKMFGEGYAAIPSEGIQAIPLQLKSKLNNTTFLLNTKAESIAGNTLKLKDGNTIAFDRLVLAGTGHLVNQGISTWRSCWNLYFKTDQTYLADDIIGLQTDSDGLINNFSFLFNELGEPIISVTVIGESDQAASSITVAVELELWTSLGINAVECIQVFQINQALPIIDNPIAPEQVSSNRPDIFICGDLYSNASLNAAMESGKQVADQL